MSEQGSTKDLSIDQENELICTKLLGWQLMETPLNQRDFWIDRNGMVVGDVPTFSIWADAGLILDALQGSELKPAGRACESLAHDLLDGLLTPLLVRAAALVYIRSLP